MYAVIITSAEEFNELICTFYPATPADIKRWLSNGILLAYKRSSGLWAACYAHQKPGITTLVCFREHKRRFNVHN